MDEITFGGLPRGRPTLICGGAGTGKTLLGMEFLVRGATVFNESGVFVSFEERSADLVKNVASLGFNLGNLEARRKLRIESITIDRSEILETGEYNLDGLFVRLGAALDAVKARRIVIDTVEVLFGALSNAGIVRSELKRLFEWLKGRGITTVVTAERGEGHLTRHNVEEYVSDCVIVLDQRVVDQIATRRLRIVKYRGSLHGTDEYPFLIDRDGFLVLPITSVALNYDASREILPTGIAKLDAMLGQGGYFRGTVAMVSGAPGTGKTSVAAHLVDAACRRGERCLYFAFEEAPAQITRNMRSIGIDLQKWVKRGSLHIFAARPASLGFELLIAKILQSIDEFRPRVVVLDPISSLDAAGTALDAGNLVSRVVDQLKVRQVSTVLTNLTPAKTPEGTTLGVSSIIDTWIHLRNIEQDGERTRALQILKSRGMSHSNQIRELLITSAGLQLEDIQVGPAGILVGSARSMQKGIDVAAAEASHREVERKRELLAGKRRALNARIAELRSEFTIQAQEIERAIEQERAAEAAVIGGRARAAVQRGRFAALPRRGNGGVR